MTEKEAFFSEGQPKKILVEFNFIKNIYLISNERILQIYQ